MSNFTPNKIDVSKINGGKKYRNGDVPSSEAFNAPIEGLLYIEGKVAATQAEVELAISNSVQKTSRVDVVYATDAYGEQITLPYSTTMHAGDLVQRKSAGLDGAGHILVPHKDESELEDDDTGDEYAVNKKDVYKILSAYPDATSSTRGFMTATQASRLDTIISMLEDKDVTIDTIREVLDAFKGAGEDLNVISALNGKRNLAPSGAKQIVYTRSSAGVETYANYTSAPNPGTIPIRQSESESCPGTFRIADPILDDNPVTLSYFDEHCSDKLSSMEESIRVGFESVARDLENTLQPIKFDYAPSYDFGEACSVYSPGSTVSGYDNRVGAKKLYILSIQELGDNIWQFSVSSSSKQPHSYLSKPAWGEYVEAGSWGEDPLGAFGLNLVGTPVSIVNGSHYPFCGVVVEGFAYEHGRFKVKFPNGIPFTEWATTSIPADPEDYTIWFPEFPQLGFADVVATSEVSGTKNFGSSAFVNVSGYGNVAGGNYALIGGRENKGGYACVVGGKGNEIVGRRGTGFGENNFNEADNSIVAGQTNKVYYSASQAAVFGRNNTVGYKDSGTNHWKQGQGYCAFVAGQECKVTANTGVGVGYGVEVSGTRGQGYGRNIKITREEQISVGKWNNPYVSATFTVGIGTSESNRKNGLEVYSDGTVRLGAEPSHDMDAVPKKLLDAALSKISIIDKKIENLEQASLTLQTDSRTAYQKTVPQSALTYASIDKIGGYTTPENMFVSFIDGIPNREEGLGWTLRLDENDKSIIYVSFNGDVDNGSDRYNLHLGKITLPQGTYAMLVEAVGVSCTVTIEDIEYATNNGDATRFSIENANMEASVYMDVYSSTAITDVPVKIMISRGGVIYQHSPNGGKLPTKVTKVVSEGANLCNPEYDRGMSSGTRSCVGIMKVEKNTDYFITASSYTVRPYFAIYGVPESNYKENPTTTEIYAATTYLGATSLTKSEAFKFNSGEFDYICFRTWKPNADYGLPSDVKFCVSTVDEYQPYFKETFEIPAEVQALPDYGVGLPTIGNEVNFERRVYTQNINSVVLSSQYWQNQGQYFQVNLSQIGLQKASIEHRSNAILDGYAYGDATQDKSWWIDSSGTGIRIRDDSFATIDEFKAYLDRANLKLVYAIAEPVETDISEYLSVDNFIRVEGGGTLTFKNFYSAVVPSSITYAIGG